MTAMNFYRQYETLAYPPGHNNSGQTWSGPNSLTLSDITVEGGLGSLTLQGTTAINEASTRSWRPVPLINDGTVTLNRGDLDVYALGGTGTIHDNNRSNITINHATGFTSSETITLDGTSSLDIIGAPKLGFLKNVSMSQGSAVTIEGLAKITAEVYTNNGILELFGPPYKGLEASLHITVPKGTEVWATQQANGSILLTDSAIAPAGHLAFFK